MSEALKEKRERYFLPEGYECNFETLTFNDGSGNVYWDEKRARSAATRIFQFPVYDYVSRLVKQRGIKKIADVGCGVAAKLAYVHRQNPDVDVVGIDQEDAILFCKKTHKFGTWYIDNFDDPDPKVPANEAELVICSDVIEHVQDPDKLLAYLKTRVKKDGMIVLSTPDRVAKYGPKLNKSGHHSHVREWSAEELAAYLEDQGFKILEHLHQWPVQIGFTKVFLRETLNQIRSGNKIRYNQVCLIKAGA